MSEFVWKPTPSASAPRYETWRRVDDNDTLYVVVNDNYIVKLRKDGEDWAAANVRIAVDDPLIDPRWTSRESTELPPSARNALDRASVALGAVLKDDASGAAADGEDER